MGLRSWLTPIGTKSEWEELSKAINEGEYSYGIAYVIQLNKKLLDFDKDTVVVAWSGDGSGSLDEVPSKFAENTLYLDNVLDECPSFKKPPKFGKMFSEPEEVLEVLK